MSGLNKVLHYPLFFLHFIFPLFFLSVRTNLSIFPTHIFFVVIIFFLIFSTVLVLLLNIPKLKFSTSADLKAYSILLSWIFHLLADQHYVLKTRGDIWGLSLIENYSSTSTLTFTLTKQYQQSNV